MSRGKVNPADSLHRFMYGVYDYYHDRGMPQKTAKVRMIDSTLDSCMKIMKDEKEVPDEMVVVMAQFMSRALNNRGIFITNAIKEHESPNDEMLKPLQDIKAAKDAMDVFIQNYKGWNDVNGKSKED